MTHLSFPLVDDSDLIRITQNMFVIVGNDFGTLYKENDRFQPKKLIFNFYSWATALVPFPKASYDIAIRK